MTAPERDRLRAAASIAAAALIAAALLAFAWRGWYSRYIVDDFCTASQLRTMGFIEAMKYPREVWSGRYSYFFVKAVFESAGSWTPRYTPALMMILLGLAAALVARRCFAAGRAPSTLFALAFVYAVIDSSPSRENIGGSIYWETGALTYLLPLVLFTAWMALFGDDRHTGRVLGVWSAVLMLAAGGLSETSLAAQGMMTAGALGFAVAFRARKAAWIAASGLGATAVAFVLVVTAPGNALRAADQTASLPIAAAVSRSVAYANDYIGGNVFVDGAAFLPLVVLTVIAASRDGRRRVGPRVLAAAALVAVACYLVSFLPGAWLLPAGPPERALDIPNYFVTLLVAIATLALAPTLARRPRIVALLAFLCCLIPVRSIVAVGDTVPEARTAAQRLDTLDATLRAQPGEHVTVRAPWALQMRIAEESPQFWANQCMSRYYGLASLRIVE